MSYPRDIAIPRFIFILLAGLFGLWLVWDSFSYRLVTYSLYADYWEHSAALTEWLKNLSNPGNPHLATDASSARYIPVYLLLTIIGGQLGLDAIDLMAISAVINYVVVVIGIYLFAAIYFRHPWAPAISFVVLFMGWGIPWIWSNLYELRSFFMTASYPSTFVFGLSMISFWLTLAFMRGRVGFFPGLLGLVLLSALMFVSHPLTAVFGIAGSCLLGVTEREAPVSLRAMVIITMLGGSLLAEWWPWFSVWDVVLASSSTVDDRTWQSFTGLAAMLERARSGVWWHLFFDPAVFFMSLGPALLGIPLSGWLLLTRRRLFIPLGVAMMTAPLILNIFYQVALAHRFLLYAVFFLHLAIVWAILELLDRCSVARQNRRSSAATLPIMALATVLGLATVGHVGLLIGDYRGAHLNYKLEILDKRHALPSGYNVPRLYHELTAGLDSNSIVIGDSGLTWPLPTFMGKAVALPHDHENSLVTDQFDRVADVKKFLAADTPTKDRYKIIKRYNVTHALINLRNTDPELLQWLQVASTPITTVGRYQMRQINH